MSDRTRNMLGLSVICIPIIISLIWIGLRFWQVPVICIGTILVMVGFVLFGDHVMHWGR